MNEGTVHEKIYKLKIFKTRKILLPKTEKFPNKLHA